MLRVGVIGASGYTGSELIRFLLTHPNKVELTCITSESYAGQPISKLHPNLKGLFDMKFENLDMEKVSQKTDIVFLGLPHKQSMAYVPKFLDLGLRVIDFSADYRLKSVESYQKWYQEHTSPHLLKDAVYGLPELHRDEIRKANLVANPGCYPTGAILAILPALKSGFVEAENIIIDAKSGISGAGKTPSEATHFPNRYDNFAPYNMGTHRHTPEINQELSLAIGKEINVCFVPHYVPMTRGILTTAYLKLLKSVSTKELLDYYSCFYNNEPFVRLLDEGELPQTQAVRGSNYIDIGMKALPDLNMVIVVSAIDNLTKGASSQALQNMNIMVGFEETAGLLYPGMMP